MFKWPIDPLLQQHLNLSNSLGPELTTNGTFTGSAAGWTLGSGWTYSANTADKDGAGTATLSQAVGAVANKVYLVSYVLTVSVATGGLTVAVGGVSGTNRTASGTYREYIKATGTGSLTFTPGDTAFRGTVDTVTVKEVGTAPADQVTVWVDDQGGTAGKATLYIRGENGTVVGIGGDGFTFGANDEDMTLLYAADTLTLAGGIFVVPTAAANPSYAFAGATTSGFGHDGSNPHVAVAGVREYVFGPTSLLAVGTVKDLGDSVYDFRDLYLGGPKVTVGSGTGLTVNSRATVQRVTHKVTVTYAALAAAATTADKVIATIPAKQRLVSIIADTTTKYIGGAVSAATLIVGKSTGGNEYIVSHGVFAAAITRGLADSDLGTSINRANAIQGGDLPSFTGTTDVSVRLTTTTANTDQLTQGSTTYYLVTELMP